LTTAHHAFHHPLQPTLPTLFFTATPPTDTYTLSLHDALPILPWEELGDALRVVRPRPARLAAFEPDPPQQPRSLRLDGEQQVLEDRKSTRLNSSHVAISYAVFCLKKKTEKLWHSVSRSTWPLA